MARQTTHGVRDERLQVEDSILPLKKTLWQGMQDTASGTRGYRSRTVFCCFKNHYVKVGSTLHQGREVVDSGQCFVI